MQACLDPWREIYNQQRPHEALALATPIKRYAPSKRPFPQALAPIQYAPADIVRKVNKDGYFSYNAISFRVSQAFANQPIALRHTMTDGQLDVFYCHMKVATVDLASQTRQ